MSGFVDRLRDIVGDRGLVVDAAGKEPYLGDWRENFMGAALAIVRPASTEEVAAVEGSHTGRWLRHVLNSPPPT